MKICMIGLGQNPIPPVGWGAVEILIWDYKQILEKFGHEVIIINTTDQNQIINICNSNSPDFVHIQYDVFWNICDKLECKNVAITSHYGYLDQEDRYVCDGFDNVFRGLLSSRNANVFALSTSNASKFIKYGFDQNRLFVTPNGSRDDLFKFNIECEFEDKSLYLAKIETRKRQHLFHNIENLYFAGNISTNSSFNRNNYLGEWTKDHLYDNLTKYANLVLLSDGEAHPLVCIEALSAGLGLVLSEYATANLDLSLPFIDVIPESKIHDIEFISEVIKHNRKKSIIMREDIRKYMMDNFSWEKIVRDVYLPVVNKIVSNKILQ